MPESLPASPPLSENTPWPPVSVTTSVVPSPRWRLTFVAARTRPAGVCSNAKLPARVCPSTDSVTFVPEMRTYGPVGRSTRSWRPPTVTVSVTAAPVLLIETPNVPESVIPAGSIEPRLTVPESWPATPSGRMSRTPCAFVTTCWSAELRLMSTPVAAIVRRFWPSVFVTCSTTKLPRRLASPSVTLTSSPSIRKNGPASSRVWAASLSVTGWPVVLTTTARVPASVTGPSASEAPSVNRPAMPLFWTTSEPLSVTSASPSARCSVADGTSTETTREPSASVCCVKLKLPWRVEPRTFSETFVPSTRRYGPTGRLSVSVPIASGVVNVVPLPR